MIHNTKAKIKENIHGWLGDTRFKISRREEKFHTLHKAHRYLEDDSLSRQLKLTKITV